MLNRRILRIKAFKVLYSCAEDKSMTLAEADSMFDSLCEAARDLYLFMLAVVPALTSEAARRIQAAKGKFNPTEEELNPNMKFVRNSLAALLDQDPDFQKLLAKKHLSWDQYDVFLRNLWDSVSSKPWFVSYMEAEGESMEQDCALFKHIFEEEFEDNEELEDILQDMSILWSDDLSYVLLFCIKTISHLARKPRWELPPLYQSDMTEKAESDSVFARRLIATTYGNSARYASEIAASVSKWDSDRLYVPDVVLVSMGLSEAENFPGIPLSATINEYVEISKFYCTPKSRSFVNGLLDRLVKQKIAEGKVTKQL